MQGEARQIALRLRHVAGRLPADDRHVPLAQPGNDVVVEPRRLRPGVERADGVLAGPPSPPDEKGVAGADRDPRLRLPRLEVGDGDALAGPQVRDPLQPRDVVEDPAGEDAVPHRQDGVLGRAPLHRDGLGNRIPVPHLPVEEAVGEAVDVGRAGTVDARIVDGVGGAPRRRADHPPLQRTGVVDAPLGIRDRRERHREPFRHQVRRLAALLRGDQVERAQLVVRPPPAPVGQLVEPGVVLGPAHQRRAAVLPGQSRCAKSHDERHDRAASHHPAPVPPRHAMSPSVPVLGQERL